MDNKYEVGQTVLVRRLDRTRTGVITEIRDTKIRVKWTEPDPAGPDQTLVPKGVLRTRPREAGGIR